MIHRRKTITSPAGYAGVLDRLGGKVDWKVELEKQLKKVNWSLSHLGCDHYSLHDADGKISGLMFFSDRIEYRSANHSIVFYLKDCEFDFYEDALSILGKDNQSLFISLYNHAL